MLISQYLSAIFPDLTPALRRWETTDQRQFLLLKTVFFLVLHSVILWEFSPRNYPILHARCLLLVCSYRSDDDYDEAIGTLLSIGASVLKVAGEKILEYYNSSEEMFNNFIINRLSIIDISCELRKQRDEI